MSLGVVHAVMLIPIHCFCIERRRKNINRENNFHDIVEEEAEDICMMS